MTVRGKAVLRKIFLCIPGTAIPATLLQMGLLLMFVIFLPWEHVTGRVLYIQIIAGALRILNS
jgi:hypothetical protein